MGRLDVSTVVGVIAGTLLLVMSPGPFAEAANGLERHAGRIHSMSPAESVLVIEEVGVNGAEQMVWVQITKAEVVRISRDPNRRWEWRERLVRLHRFPAGTFVVAIGRRDSSGTLHAIRVEIPKIEPLQEEFVYVW